ncbi:MAG: hypothetical protein U9R58_06525, partial [Chloroflexota bacterium]|nr:hypothetical protein [Chloroflexota bacterium]
MQKNDEDTTIISTKVYNGIGELIQSQTNQAEIEGSLTDVIMDYGYEYLDGGSLVQQSMPYTATLS